MPPAVSAVEVQRFWERFRRAEPSAPARPEAVWHFGDGEALAAELAALVAAGTKTATAGLVWEYEVEGAARPRVGGFSVVTTFAGSPLFVLQTTEVTIRPFDAVDERFRVAFHATS